MSLQMAYNLWGFRGNIIFHQHDTLLGIDKKAELKVEIPGKIMFKGLDWVGNRIFYLFTE